MFDMQSGVVISILVVNLLIPLIAVNADPTDNLSRTPLSTPQLQDNENKNNLTKSESPPVNSESNTGPNNQHDGDANDLNTGSETKNLTAKPDREGDLKSDGTGNNVTDEGKQDGDDTKPPNTNTNNTNDNVEHASSITNSDSTTGKGNKTEPSLATSVEPTGKNTTDDQSGETGETNRTVTAGSSVGTSLGRGNSTTEVVADNSSNAEVITHIQQPTNESQHDEGQPTSTNISKESTPTVPKPNNDSPPNNDLAVGAITMLEKLKSSTPSNGDHEDAEKINPTQQSSDDSKIELESRNDGAGGDIVLDGKTPVVSSDGSKTESAPKNHGDEKTPGVSSTKEPEKDSPPNKPLLDKPLIESESLDNNEFYDSDDDAFDESRDTIDLQDTSEEHDSGGNHELADIHFPDIDMEEGGSHFFAFILTAMFCTAAMYLLYHNKRKVAAFVFPGAQRRTGMRHRSGHQANYERLQSKPDGGTYVF